jgi:D-arginine dehydrogenase
LIHDIAIIGGGIAGASLAHFVGTERSVLMLEREAFHGYHASGRSAAEFTRRFHAPLVGKLAAASADFLANSPQDFCEIPLLKPRGNLLVADAEKAAHLSDVFRREAQSGGDIHMQSLEEAIARVPFLDPDVIKAAFYDPDCYDVETESLLQSFVKSARRQGGEIKTGCELLSARHNGSAWEIETSLGVFSAKVLVNAAGAWADKIAELCGIRPLGLTPFRRTAISIDLPEGIDASALPEVCEIDEVWYFKPDAGRLLVSPADATESEPCDAQPEELDVAYAVHYLEEATTLEVKAVAHKWAGLRTFALDRLPVVGFDSGQPAFFWLAGQGGYGIQSSPALGQYAADLLLGKELSEILRNAGLTGDEFRSDRFPQ